MNRLALALNVQPGEGRLVSLLFLHAVLLGMAEGFVLAPAHALFMTEFDAQALARRRLSGSDLVLTNSSSLDVLQRELRNPHPGVVVYAPRALEEIEHESLPSFLQNVLSHPAPEVRQHALQRVEGLGLTAALSAVEQCVVQEPVATVRGAAVRTLAALGQTGSFAKVSAYLEERSLCTTMLSHRLEGSACQE